MEWVTHNNAKALEFYNKAKEIGGNEKISDSLTHDKKVLLERGVSENELLLLRDLIVS